MDSAFDSIAERRIAEAMARGEFDGLPGSGRPLELDDDRLVPEEVRAAWRVLKNAGLVPPEVLALRRARQGDDAAATDRGDARGTDEETRRARRRRLLALQRLRALRG